MTDTWRVLFVLMAFGLVAEAIFLVALMRQVGSLLLVVGTTRPLDLPAGPKVGARLSLPGYPKGRPAVVAFVSPDCTQCKSLAPGFGRLHELYRDQLDVVAVVAHADPETRTRYAAEIGAFARTDMPALMQDWEIPGTPYAVALDGSRRVKGGGIVNTLDQLETLAVTALALDPASSDDGAPPAETEAVDKSRQEEVVV